MNTKQFTHNTSGKDRLQPVDMNAVKTGSAPSSMNRKFRRDYDRLFRKDPLSANLFLMLCELAGPDGKIILPENSEAMDQELRDLLVIRFEDPRGYAL